MKKLKYGIFIVILIVIAGFVFISHKEAYKITHNPKSDRTLRGHTPADAGLEYKDITVVNNNDQTLHGWYIPPKNGATVMLIHGYKSNRIALIKVAQILVRNDYGILFTSMRSHDVNDGDLITFGIEEIHDIAAWYQFLKNNKDANHIGVFGNSFGGYMAIKYAAQNEEIKAVVSHSAFSSIKDTMDKSIKALTGLPPDLFAPLIGFWMEREIDGDLNDLDAKKWIGKISPRPVFIMQGGADEIVSAESGKLLFQTAGEPKELWFEPELGHIAFFYDMPEEFEKRVIGFFDRYLLKKENLAKTVQQDSNT